MWDLPGGATSDSAVTDWAGEAVVGRSLPGIGPDTTVALEVVADYNNQVRRTSTEIVTP